MLQSVRLAHGRATARGCRSRRGCHGSSYACWEHQDSDPCELLCAQVRQSSGLSGLRSSARRSGSSVAGGLGGWPPLASPGY